MMVSLGLKMIRKTILNKAKFDINKLEPIVAAESCFIPALFVHGESDTFIPAHHSKELNAKYAGDKNLILVEGDHNSVRPRFFYDSVSIFFHNMLLSPEEQEDLKARKEEPSRFSLNRGFLSSGGMDVSGGSPNLYEPSLEELEEEMLRQALMLSLQESDGALAPEIDSSQSEHLTNGVPEKGEASNASDALKTHSNDGTVAGPEKPADPLRSSQEKRAGGSPSTSLRSSQERRAGGSPNAYLRSSGQNKQENGFV